MVLLQLSGGAHSPGESRGPDLPCHKPDEKVLSYMGTSISILLSHNESMSYVLDPPRRQKFAVTLLSLAAWGG